MTTGIIRAVERSSVGGMPPVEDGARDVLMDSDALRGAGLARYTAFAAASPAARTRAIASASAASPDVSASARS